MSGDINRENLEEQQDELIMALVAMFNPSPLITAIFALLTIGGGVGIAAINDFSLAYSLFGGWMAIFGVVIVTEAVHGMPTVNRGGP